MRLSNKKFLIGLIILGIICFFLVQSTCCSGKESFFDLPSVTNNVSNKVSGSGTPWGPSDGNCPALPVCEACDCPPGKTCPVCPGIPGFYTYGPSSIHYNAPSGTYTCPSTLSPGFCVLPNESAPAACLADSNCVGFLKLNPTDTTSMLINALPENSGPSTPAVWFEKKGNTPTVYITRSVQVQSSAVSFSVSPALTQGDIGKTIIISVNTAIGSGALQTALLGIKNYRTTISDISSGNRGISVPVIPSLVPYVSGTANIGGTIAFA